jgi:hypothetical protein
VTCIWKIYWKMTFILYGYILYLYNIPRRMVLQPSLIWPLIIMAIASKHRTSKRTFKNKNIPWPIDTAGKKEEVLAKWEKDFKIDNKLVYSPLNLIVVPDDDRDMVLKKIYEDINQGVGQGISLILCKWEISTQISGEAMYLLSKISKLYQITKSQNHTTNKTNLWVPHQWEIWDWLHKYGSIRANGGIDRGTIHINCWIILVERCGYVL